VHERRSQELRARPRDVLLYAARNREIYNGDWNNAGEILVLVSTETATSARDGGQLSRSRGER